MQEFTITRTKTTVTLTDGQTSWTFDRANTIALAARLKHHAAQLEDDAPVETRRVSGFAVARKGAL